MNATSKSTFLSRVPLEVAGVVVDFYCADVNDAAELATVSTSWREAVVASLLWSQRVEPIMRRNPFPLLEREHLAWHWDCSDAVHLALLVEYIMNFWFNSTSFGFTKPLSVWVQCRTFIGFSDPIALMQAVVKHVKTSLQERVRSLNDVLTAGLLASPKADVLFKVGTACWGIIEHRFSQMNLQFEEVTSTTENSKPKCIRFLGVGIKPSLELRKKLPPTCETVQQSPGETLLSTPNLRQLKISSELGNLVLLHSQIFTNRDGVVSSSVKRLTHLSIEHHTIHIDEFSMAMRHLKSLQFLSTNMPAPPTEDNTAYDLTDKVPLPPSLHAVHLQSINMGVAETHTIDPILEELEIVTTRVFEALSELPQLRRLALNFEDHLSQDAVLHLSRCKALEAFTMRIHERTESGKTRDQYKILVLPPSRLVGTLKQFHIFEMSDDSWTGASVVQSLTSVAHQPALSAFSKLTTLHTAWCRELANVIRHNPTFALKLNELGICGAVGVFDIDEVAMNLRNVSSVTVNVSCMLDFCKLNSLPSLRKLIVRSVNDYHILEPNNHHETDAFLCQWHTFPCLETLIFDTVEWGLSWHMFTNQNVCESFRKASAKSLRHVSMRCCNNFCCNEEIGYTPHDQFYPPFDDNVELNKYSLSVLAESVRTPASNDNTQWWWDSDDDDDFLLLPNDKSNPPSDNDDGIDDCGCRVNAAQRSEVEKFKDLHFPFPHKDWKFYSRMKRKFNFGDKHNERPGRSCLLALRRAMVFWRTLYPRTKFSVLDIPANPWEFAQQD